MALDDISEAEAEQILKDLQAGRISPGRIERQKGNIVIMPLEPPEPEEVRQPVSMFDTTQGVGSTFFSRPPQEGLKKVLSVTQGVAELFNPVPLIRTAETLARATVEDAEATGLSGVLERIEKASAKSVTPRGDIPQLLSGLRAAGETFEDVITGESALSEIPEAFQSNFAKEFEIQQQFEKNLIDQDIKNTSELVGGGVSLVLLLKNVPKFIVKKIQTLRALGNMTFEEVLILGKQKVEGLKQVLRGPSSALTKEKKASELAQKLIGDTTSEVGNAVKNRTNNVEVLFKGSPDTRSLLPEVNRIRTQIDETQRLLGEVVGDMKTVLLGKTKVRFDATRIKQLTRGIRFKGKIGGEQFIDKGTLRFLDKIDSALKKDPTAATVVKLVERFDARLTKFYRARSRGEAVDPTDLQLFRVREALDDGLVDIFPAYKQAKTAWKQFKESADQIRGPIDGKNAESFMANLFNQNKTEVRDLLGDLISQGKEAANNMIKLSNKVKTGFQDINLRLRATVARARKQAKKFQSETSEALFNDIIDKIAARKLKAAGESGFADVPADKVRQAIENRIKDAENRGELTGKLIATMITAVVSGDIGVAELIAGIIGGNMGKTIFRIFSTAKAKRENSVTELFKLMKDAKTSSRSVREWATDMIFLATEGGSEVVATMLRTVKPSLEVRTAMQRAAVQIGSLKAVTPEVLSRDIEFDPGSTVTPGAQ